MILLTGLIAGCSSASGTSVTTSDVAAYRDMLDRVDAAVTAYQAAMSTATPSTCPGMRDDYDHAVRPIINDMVAAASGMDSMMGMHAGSGVADMECVANLIMHELDHHHAVACTGATIDADRLEVARHVAAMRSYHDHAATRCNELDDGMGGHGWHWDDAMDGCGMGHHDGMM